MEHKVLIIQEAGHHFANKNYREALSLQCAFKKLNIKSTVWGSGYDNFKTDFDEIIVGHDIILVVENYSFDWIPDLKKYNGLKLFWSIDGHIPSTLENHFLFVQRNQIDVALSSNFFAVEQFAKYSHSHYFPNCYDDDLIYPMYDIPKIHNIGFCGNVGQRESWLNLLEDKYHLKKDIFVIGDNMVRALNSYKIAFNRNLSCDINYRTFEVCGTKTLLFTNETEGLKWLFDLERDLVLYDNEADLVHKVGYYLNNEGLRNNIAKNGYEKVKSKHTYKHRAELLIKIASVPKIKHES